MNVLNSLKGGRKRKRSMRKMRSSKRRQNQNQNQNGGFFPGLYAAQHKFKSGSRGKQPSNYSLKKFKKFKFTRRI
jgi:hypothetical protein